MKKSIPILIFAFLTTSVYSAPSIDSVLRVLNREIEKRKEYYAEKERVIATFKAQIPKVDSEQERFNLYNYIFKEYESYQYDSAYVYALKSCEIADKMKNREAFVKSRKNLLFCLMSSGLFKEAFDIVDQVKPEGISNELRGDYYYQCARFYSNAASYTTSEPYHSLYDSRKNRYCDSALLYLPPNSYLYHNVKAFKNLSFMDNHEKIEVYKNLLSSFDADNHQRAINHSILGALYYGTGDVANAIYNIALSAIYDTRGAITETTAKTTLARYLYDRGDLENASRYIGIALEEANYYNAKHRKIDINSILPIIEKDRLDTLKQQKNQLIYGLILVGTLFLSLLVSIIVIYRVSKKIKDANTIIREQYEDLHIIAAKLEEANEIKDQYIIQALYGKSEYLEMVENLLKKMDRRFRARQYDELNSLFKDFNVKTERENVSSSFDEAFLKLFPNFIEELNLLLKEEERIVVDSSENLPPEIRIFALIRLGIDDNEKIARFLNISVNTIYAYKTKIKNRSIIPRKDFESRVMEIEKKLKIEN